MAIRGKRLRSCSEVNPSRISNLDDDVLVEILIRLPTSKSAFRCKPVCKRWRSLIASACFRRCFVSHHQSMDDPLTLLLHTDDASEPQSVIMSFIPPMPDRVRACFKVLDCFQDLLLCGFMDLSAVYGKGEKNIDKIKIYNRLGRTYVVCNPFTKQWMALPLAPEKEVGYEAPVTRLVCEPLSTSDPNYRNLDLGDDQVRGFSSEYRFRVVCIYQHKASIKLDVFCSESGKWTKEALVFPGYRKLRHKNVCSCNGELFWLYGTAKEVDDTRDKGRHAEFNPMLAALNPFRLDIPPTCIDVSEFSKDAWWDISVSRGALHMIELKELSEHARLRVWRLEKGPQFWMEECERLLETKTSRCNYDRNRERLENTPMFNYDLQTWRRLCERLSERKSCCNYELEHCKILDLHPEKSEIVFFRYFPPTGGDDILCCDLTRGKLEFFTNLSQLVPRWTMFQPRVPVWPTPIPRYEELRGMYDGNCNWFSAANNKFLNSGSEQQVTAPSITEVAAIDTLCTATQTLKNVLVDKMSSVPPGGGKVTRYYTEVLSLNEELIKLRAQREEILSR